MDTDICPLKPEETMEDQWRDDDTCVFCDGLKPETVLARIEQGDQVVPTDKSYKLYLNPGYQQVYFQHFTKEQREKLVTLLNENKVAFADPGYFYVLPFFIRPMV